MVESPATAAPERVVEVTPRELPLSCPSRHVDAAAMHPRVYIPLRERGGRAACPYCGTVYQLID